MLNEYLDAAMKTATYDIVEDDHTYFGEIPQCQGVWANAQTLEQCREELIEVLEEWVFLRIARNLPLPVMDGIELKIKDAV